MLKKVNETGVDYVPRLREVARMVLSINEHDLDAQELDYILELQEYLEYMVLTYERELREPRPDFLFLDELGPK